MSDAERLGIIETRVDAVVKDVADHEDRIRVNEKLGIRMLTISALGSFIGGAVSTLIALLALL